MQSGRRLAHRFLMNSIPVRDLRVQINAGVQILNLASGVVEKRLSFPGPVHQLDFTDDSRHLVTGNATIYVVRMAPPSK